VATAERRNHSEKLYLASSAVATLLWEPPELAETAGRIGLELLFARCPDVAAFREAEHVFGIDFGGLVRACAGAAVRGASRAKHPSSEAVRRTPTNSVET